MPVKLSALQDKEETKDIVLDFGKAGTIEMTVLTNEMNLGRQRRIKAAIKDSDLAALADEFFSVVKKWDLQDPKGKPIPLTPDGIDQLDVKTMNTIAEKMGEALSPPTETSTS